MSLWLGIKIKYGTQISILSESEFYGDLVYKFKKSVGRNDFSDQFRKIIIHYKRIGYNMNVMRQTTCLVVNPITVNKLADLFNCTPVGSGLRLNDVSGIKLSIKLAGAWWSVFGRAHRGLTVDFCCSSVSELVCCWVLVLFHLSDESWFIRSLFWFINE